MDYKKKSLDLHKKYGGKIEIMSSIPLRNKDDLSVAYTPGVGAVSSFVAKDTKRAYTHTIKGRSVAVVSDGSAVLGLGNIGPEGALPVMEGKALLMKKFANIDAYPIVLDTQDPDEIVRVVELIAPGFAGINLEDISAPRCFEIEARLQDLGIPVFHDDQHGTAIVVFAGLINAAKVVKKDIKKLKVVINGAGAAGIAVAKILRKEVRSIILCDSRGIIYKGRKNLNWIKKEILSFVNKKSKKGTLADALVGADVFIGVSAPNVVTQKMVKSMSLDPIIFALANPVPEIYPDDAKKAGAKVVSTGRSDFPNQINNVLAFPGIFRGAIDARIPRITEKMKRSVAYSLAKLVKRPTANSIFPSAFNKKVVPTVAKAVRRAKGK